MTEYAFTPDQIRAYREAWLAKLESEEMQGKQGTGTLEDYDGDMCCLGVACTIICPETRHDANGTEDEGDLGYNILYGEEGSEDVAPQIVVAALGLRSDMGLYRDSDEDEELNAYNYGEIRKVAAEKNTLADLNDTGNVSFRQIARFIRDNEKRVFLSLPDAVKA